MLSGNNNLSSQTKPFIRNIPKSNIKPISKNQPKLNNLIKNIQRPITLNKPISKSIPKQKNKQIIQNVPKQLTKQITKTTPVVPTPKINMIIPNIPTPPTNIPTPFYLRRNIFKSQSSQRKNQIFKQPKSYTPSGFAISFGIRAKRTERIGSLSGLGLRPIISRRGRF
jgi:hypothetical protein